VKVPADLDRRFRERAVAGGDVDVAYDLVDSPLGALLVASTERGLCRVEFDPEPERDLEPLAREFGFRVLRAPKALDEPKRELTQYFEGARTSFELPVDVRFGSAFRVKVMDELARVPYGQVTTYGALAALAGNPGAARAVGTFMNRNPVPIVLPCHRVVGANGSLVGYGGGLERKERLLQLEGASLTLRG
jgi:methylated-DNA-[protein]-cysteine S-methyltransferase